jgi:anaerobic magnesium-protoporphyrin IX monomethyl ester cyclase
MKKGRIVFIANQEYDNLGIGYMRAVLHEAAFETETIDINEKRKKIIRKLDRLDPLIIGFSVIHQNYIDRFRKLIDFLRDKGYKCHFTAGGHYASLRYEELFKMEQGLDSIVRFEGEYTILELAEALYSGKEWRTIRNLAFVTDSGVVANPLRPLENDLDKLPFPARTNLKLYAFDKLFVPILAGRGCLYNCSFCNLREFYLPFGAKMKRTRKPAMILKEMDHLYRKKGCSIFLFQDDDFPVKKDNRNEWIEEFCNGIKEIGLKGKIMWKINCRPDEIEESPFRLMKNNGLFHVFLGIEDGTDSGLKALNKKMSVEKSLAGLQILRKLNIGFDFGFMLFQPSTTFRSLDENLRFLERICGDGYSPVTIMKLIPFYKTTVEKELIAQGRLNGGDENPDYNFLEDQMNPYFEFINSSFNRWTKFPGGVYNISMWARNYISVFTHYYGMTEEINLISENVQKVISESNLFLLNTLREVASLFETGDINNSYPAAMIAWRKRIKNKEKKFRNRINNSMYALLTDFERQKYLLPLLSL